MQERAGGGGEPLLSKFIPTPRSEFVSFTIVIYTQLKLCVYDIIEITCICINPHFHVTHLPAQLRDPP